MINNRLMPKYTDLSYAPEYLLTVIKCSCKTGCRNLRCNCMTWCINLRCNCMKHGMQCTSACMQCRGICCENGLKPNEMNDFDENE